MRDRLILDLCGGTGAWSKPYWDAGYSVVVVDPAYDAWRHTWRPVGLAQWHKEKPSHQDVRLVEFNPKVKVHGILAAPPCTHLSGSGARWWAQKGEGALLEALATVDACLRAVVLYQPEWWALENPVGRLTRYLGKPQLYFNPCDYGDPWTKRTCLWGRFNHPEPSPVEPTEGSKMHLMPPGLDRARLRSETPPGFARAFFEANA